MVTKVAMPKFSETMREGTIVKWLKREGERVEKGEPFVEILSEKLTYELEAPESGVLLKVLASEGSDVPVLQPIAFIGEPSEEIPKIEVPLEKVEEKMPPIEEAEVKKIKIPIKASPVARKLARDYNVDLTQIEGSGPEGRIVEEDVKRFVEKLKVVRRVREVVPLAGIRKVTAERVLHSARTAPSVTLIMDVDASEIVKLRREIIKKANVQVSYTDILVKAVAKVLEEQPILNSTIEDEQIKIFDDINIGVAVSTEKGLLVPVVHDANKKSLVEIASTSKELIEKARRGVLTERDLTGGTFTITNLGMLEVDAFTPIINPPECAILGVGKLADKPVVVDGKIEVRPMAYLCLSFDHRIVDGYPASEFMQRLKKILENPIALLTPL